MRKKVIAVILASTMAAAGCVPVWAEAEGGDVVVLYTNDIHCAVNEDEENQVLGYAKVAGLKKQLEEEGNEVVLVDIGDAIQGDVIGTLSEGEYIIDIMDQVGYDLAVPGNHEFDYGMEQFLSLTEEASFPYVSCNFTDLTTNETVFEPYEIMKLGGKQIAFLGICTPKTITSSTPKYFQDESGEFIYGFAQDDDGTALYECVQEAADAAREEGADYVIAVSHLGIDASCSPWTSSEVIENTSGIDVFLDGHSHSVVEGDMVKNKDGEEVLLTSTGTKLASVGELTISADGTMTSALVSDGMEADPETESFISEINTEFEDVLNEVVAKTDVALVVNDPETLDQEEPVRLVRTSETNLGDLCADAYRAVTGADIGFANGGGVRADIAAGDITYADIISVQPFGNEICMVEATGQQILDALEMGVMDLPAESGGFQQVSGITFEVHTYIDSSVQVDADGMFVGVDGEYRVKNVKVGGEDLDLNATYTVASHNYMLKNGGDGFNMFQECNMPLEDIMLDNQALIQYITEDLGGTVGEEYANPYGDGRITIVEDAAAAGTEESADETAETTETTEEAVTEEGAETASTEEPAAEEAIEEPAA